MTVIAPAKLNLILEVLAKRPDGYHDIRTVLQAVSLYDELRFEPASDLIFESSLTNWIPERSLISKAANLLKKATGYPGGARINISQKRIPLFSGLGGDSSDAAATLRGLNQLWQLDLSRTELHELAGQMGSDVPFFLYDSTALAEGKGEKITPLPSLPHIWVVLIIPAIPRQPGKTARLYASLNPGHYTDGQITERFIHGLTRGDFSPSGIFNTFENVAFTCFPELSVYREHIIKIGADNVHLAGSGPALFTLVKEKASAEDLYTRLKHQGMETFLVESL